MRLNGEQDVPRYKKHTERINIKHNKHKERMKEGNVKNVIPSIKGCLDKALVGDEKD